MTSETLVAVKVTTTAGLGSLIVATTGDIEFMVLMITGVFAATTSYFYDWVHRDPRKLGLREVSEVIKYILYGVTVMFVVFYLGMGYGSRYIELPLTAWGLIATVAAGSAISIVGWSTTIAKEAIRSLLKVSKGSHD